MPFIIQGTSNGQTVYWRKWTSDAVSGRPKWVNRLTLKCLYANRSFAEQVVNGTGSTHFNSINIENVTIREITELP